MLVYYLPFFFIYSIGTVFVEHQGTENLAVNKTNGYGNGVCIVLLEV
jgi:hypothetical protein